MLDLATRVAVEIPASLKIPERLPRLSVNGLPIGRPSTFTEEKGKEICERIAQGYTVTQITKLEGMPSKDTLYSWLFHVATFADAFYRAREAAAEPMAEQTLEIADDTSGDILETADGRFIPNGAAVKRAELKVGFRQWLMGKWSKRYADRQHVELSGTLTLELGNRLDQACRRLEAPTIDVTPEPASVQPSETKG